MKKIIIIGASSGIGLHFAEALLSRGVKVGLAARHTRVLHELKLKYPDLVEYEAIDITHPSAVEKLNKLIDKLGGMDIYFHSSGIGYSNISLDPETEAKVVRTNSEGFARMTSAAYRYFYSNGIRGQIAAITSVAGTNGIARLAAYSASKKFCQTYLTALEQLSNNERAGVIFTDLRPGWVRTPLISADAKYPMEMDVDYVVNLIIKAIAQRRRVAVIDWRWNVVVGLWRLLPNAIWTHVNMPVSMPEPPLPSPAEQREIDLKQE